MGADLIGHFLVRPVKLEKKEKQQIEKHINNLKKAIKNKDVKAFRELIPDPDYWDLSEDADPEDLEVYNELIKEAEDFLKEYELPYRDVAEMGLSTHCSNFTKELNVKRQVLITFAGEMSWGDAPDGTGYVLIETLGRLGIAELLHNFCFPE